MNLKKGVSMVLAFVLVGTSALACAEVGKEEVIYAVLSAQGQVDGLYAVNIFDGGDIVDYGDYSSVHPLNTEDQIAYENGEVRFHSDAQRVYYQGNLNTRDLPWLFRLTYRLEGQEIAAQALAGKSGHVEIELDVRQNPAYTGELFKSHALQISAALDTDKCCNISAEGATQANVGMSRQLSYIVLPGTEKTILISTDATAFEMDAISINGVQLSLDIDVDSSELTEQTEKIIDAGERLDDGAQELLDGAAELTWHSAELLDGAKQIVDAVYETANDTLEVSKDDFNKLGISLRPLTSANYSTEISRLQSELLENVDDYIRREADSRLAGMVESAAREQVEVAVKAAARAQVTDKVTDAAREEVRTQVRQQVSNGVEAEIRKAVTQELTQTTATPEPGDEPSVTTVPEAESSLAAWLRSIFPLGITGANAEGLTLDEQIDAIVSQRMASPEVQAQIDALTDAQMNSAETRAAINAETAQRMQNAEIQAVIDGQTQQEISDPATRSYAEDAARQEIRPQVEAAARQKIRDRILNLSDEEVQALVEQQMQSDAVQSQIESAVAKQMASQQVQSMIAAEIETQMASDAVQQKIDAEVAAQLASSDTQALLESTIDQQMQSEEVQRLIRQNIEEQMVSSEVQRLIAQNIDEQMDSAEVRSRIANKMEQQRQSQEYLDSVAQALEENGENGEAYRTLSDLRKKLDDVQKFYDGLNDYSDSVRQLLDGAQDMKDGTGEFRSETANINDTIREKIDSMIADKTGSDVALSSFIDSRNTAVDNVQFVITTPAIRISAVQPEEAAQPESTGILEKIRNLFK